MDRSIAYTLSFGGTGSVIDIQELNGREIVKTPDQHLHDKFFLDDRQFTYHANFIPFDSDTFTKIEVHKCQKNGEAEHSEQMLTLREADGIVEYLVRTALKIRGFDLTANADDYADENDDDFEDDNKTDEEIEADISELVKRAEGDFSEIEEYLYQYKDEYCGDDIYEYAFREAIRQSKANYVEEHADDFDLNDMDEYSTFFDDAEEERIAQILLSHGAHRSIDDYYSYSFAVETVNDTIMSFDEEFQQEVFAKYLNTFGLTEAQVIRQLESGDCGKMEDLDRDIEEDMSALGVKAVDGKLVFLSMFGCDGGSCTEELLEQLGWPCNYDGSSWELERAGVYYIK